MGWRTTSVSLLGVFALAAALPLACAADCLLRPQHHPEPAQDQHHHHSSDATVTVSAAFVGCHLDFAAPTARALVTTVKLETVHALAFRVLPELLPPLPVDATQPAISGSPPPVPSSPPAILRI